MNASEVVNIIQKKLEKEVYKNINFVIPQKVEAIKENIELYTPFIIRASEERHIYKNLELIKRNESIVILANNKKITNPLEFLNNLKKFISKVGDLNIYCQVLDDSFVGYGDFILKEFLDNKSLSILTKYVVL